MQRFRPRRGELRNEIITEPSQSSPVKLRCCATAGIRSSVDLMEQQASTGLMKDLARLAAPARQRPLSALVTVPVVTIGAACILPVAVAAFGLTRLAQGRLEGLGSDSVAAARSLWRAKSAAVGALTSYAAPRN